MKLELTEQYKSFTTPITIELPEFTILTGINGSGKTHLLSGISEGIVRLSTSEGVLNAREPRTRINVNCKYLSSHSLSPNQSSDASRQILIGRIQALWKQHVEIGQSISNRNIKLIAENAKKEPDALTLDDFYKYYPLDEGIHQHNGIQVDIFQLNLSALFKNYYDRLDENKYNRYRFQSEGHKKLSFLSEEDFVKTFGEPPWDITNRIIKEAQLDYKVNSPVGLHQDEPFKAKLTSTINNAEIEFSDLSSGEKVLMSLAFAFYNSKFDLAFPKVLLIDEPDASLHPSMTRQFLNVLERVFVKDKGVKVIITTHSPSTVALCNETNLFVMNKTEPRIEKTTKDKALRILTSGVPSLSINYENRRQVFVESKYDVFFYERVCDKLRQHLVDGISLNFISSGIEGSGSSDQVREVVNKLSGFGNKFIFGIIDWDKKNTPNGYVKVLGQDKRYSIENYIFDPILVCALLMREKIVARNELALSENENYFDFKNFPTSRLQGISNFLTTKMSVYAKPHDNCLQRVRYCNGIELVIPQWYLFCNGHELETHLKNAFPELKRYMREGDLKREVVEKVIDEMPELIPQDILDLLRGIQEH